MNSVCVALVLVLAVGGTYGQQFWSACTTAAPQPPPLAMTSPNCTATSCTTVRTQVLQGQLTFTATAAHTSLQSTFHAFRIQGELLIGQMNPAICDELEGVRCGPGSPLVAGTSYVWNVAFVVPNDIPLVDNVNIRGKFYNIFTLT